MCLVGRLALLNPIPDKVITADLYVITAARTVFSASPLYCC